MKAKARNIPNIARRIDNSEIYREMLREYQSIPIIPNSEESHLNFSTNSRENL